MKHLRKFNEGSEGLTQQEEVQDFCEMNLAYLMDEGFAKLPTRDKRLMDTEVSSLEDLEQVEDDLIVQSFYIRVKKKN